MQSPFWKKELGWKLKNLAEIAQEGQELNLPVSFHPPCGEARGPQLNPRPVCSKKSEKLPVCGAGETCPGQGVGAQLCLSSQRGLNSSLFTPVKIPKSYVCALGLLKQIFRRF